MNVVDVYRRWGITGRGTVVSILDDGIEKDHPDLSKNYVLLLLLSLHSLTVVGSFFVDFVNKK